MTRKNSSIWQDTDSLPMPFVLVPATCVFAFQLADLHANTLPHMVVPTTVIDVLIALYCQLAFPFTFIVQPVTRVGRVITRAMEDSLSMLQTPVQATLVVVSVLKQKQNVALVMVLVKASDHRTVLGKPVFKHGGLRSEVYDELS
jgi:hypothetical protein